MSLAIASKQIDEEGCQAVFAELQWQAENEPNPFPTMGNATEKSCPFAIGDKVLCIKTYKSLAWPNVDYGVAGNVYTVTRVHSVTDHKHYLMLAELGDVTRNFYTAAGWVNAERFAPIPSKNRQFAIGDKVRCIKTYMALDRSNVDPVTEGNVYTVTRSYSTGDKQYLMLAESFHTGWVNAERFEPIPHDGECNQA